MSKTGVVGGAVGVVVVEAKAPSAERRFERLRHVRAWILPVSAGALAALALAGLYFLLVYWAQGLDHAGELLWDDRYLVAAASGGFGLQIGLFVYVRRLVSRAARRSSASVAVAGTGTSSIAMLACCAHHVADALPLVGLSGAAVLLGQYRTPLLGLGLAMNFVGVGFMLRMVWTASRRMREEGNKC